ncbi:outer membrane protein assembly factor, partial [Acidobacteriota bacterium]
LHSKGYFEADVQVESISGDKGTVIQISSKRGSRYRIGEVLLKGNPPFSQKAVRRNLASLAGNGGDPFWMLLDDFQKARVRILDMLAERGYLHPRVLRPRFTARPDLHAVDIELTIESGPVSRVNSIKIEGNSLISLGDILSQLALKPLSIFSPLALSEDQTRLLNFYKVNGYQNASVDIGLQPAADGVNLDLIFEIEEGTVHRIKEIRVTGNKRTAEWLVLRNLRFRPGDLVRADVLMASQKNLFDLSLFRSIYIRQEPASESSDEEIIHVKVEESPVLTMGYGLRFNSEDKFEGFGQVDFNNMLGRGRIGVLYYRENRNQKELRFSLKDPYLFGARVNTLHSFSFTKDVKSIFVSEEIGYSVRQEFNLPFRFSLSYAYRLSRIHTYELESIGPFPFDITLFLSEIQSYLVRDTRSDKLSPAKGSFFSMSFTYSPAFLGSELPYISFFAQYSFFLSLGRRVVWASNVRVGLADAFDQYLIPSRRFFAGGINSLRGFERDRVGPIDPFFGDALGGEGLFVMNQEIRFPLYRWLGGVLFYDAGNVYENLGDFNPLKLRHTLGLGLRLDTPFVFLRIDYGFNLFPMEGEKGRVLSVSIGQIF